MINAGFVHEYNYLVLDELALNLNKEYSPEICPQNVRVRKAATPSHEFAFITENSVYTLIFVLKSTYLPYLTDTFQKHFYQKAFPYLTLLAT